MARVGSYSSGGADTPAEQVGHFPDEAGAQEWIEKSSADWVRAVEEGPGSA